VHLHQYCSVCTRTLRQVAGSPAQGREKEICIFTTVRSKRKGSIGFVADVRRINVGLSRARSSLLVVGNAAALRKDKQWAGVTSYAKSIG